MFLRGSGVATCEYIAGSYYGSGVANQQDIPDSCTSTAVQATTAADTTLCTLSAT